VRERVKIGENSIVGANVVVENDTTVGARVKIQTGAYVTAHVIVEDDVFIAPAVITTNDNTMGRHGADHANKGPIFRRGCRIGAGAILLPGVEIGEEAFVAAGALVTRDVAPGMLAMGSPAREVRASDSAS
jgi:acetyltransferase-like isoleucine patch superfamily enzyme